jgi:HK97 family phage portal protein
MPVNWESLLSAGYTPLSQNPEIISAVNKIANLIGSMTIHLMENSKNGDQRISNALSNLVDIHPNKYMTRMTWMSSIVRSLLLEGDGNCVLYPRTVSGLIEGIYPLNPGSVSFVPNGDFGYSILYNGKEYLPEDLIHIVINPDPTYPWKGVGYRKSLRSVAETLDQASATKKGFMESKWQPSLIVKVDGMVDEFSNSDGRQKLLDKYIKSNQTGEPWLIPADGFDVVTVKPLSLNDLAIKDSVEMDKKTVASILDVPAFVLGAGEFNKEEWNNWINTRIKGICECIQQALTRSLLIKPEWYFRFNYRSLYAYDIQTLSTVGCDLYTRGIVTGNEVRDSLGYSPMDGLDELIILENYIPQGMIGDQKKLEKGGENNG